MFNAECALQQAQTYNAIMQSLFTRRALMRTFWDPRCGVPCAAQPSLLMVRLPEVKRAKAWALRTADIRRALPRRSSAAYPVGEGSRAPQLSHPHHYFHHVRVLYLGILSRALLGVQCLCWWRCWWLCCRPLAQRLEQVAHL